MSETLGGVFVIILAACGSSTSTATATSTPALQSAAAPSSPSVAGARPLPDNLCTAIGVPTINSVIGVKVAAGIWDGHACTWISTNPAGGLTLDRISETLASRAVTAGAAAGGTFVPGLGRGAIGTSRTGMPLPLPASQAQVIIDLGNEGLSVHISGPKVTLDEGIQIAHDLLG